MEDDNADNQLETSDQTKLDTKLLQALLLTRQPSMALELLRGVNYCDLKICEEILRKDNHNVALLELYKAFGRLGASVKKLLKVVSEEVPGILSSLKLSSLKLNELTQQFSILRHKIVGVPMGTKGMNTVRSKSSRKKNLAS